MGGKAGPKADAKERAKLLKEKFDWDENAARKIWCWGPETEGANVVVDQTQGVQYLIEIKEHVNSAFQWTAKEGPLCEENMRGIRFNIMDVTLHTDAPLLLRRGADGETHAAGASVPRRDHMPARGHERRLQLHESAAGLRFRGESTRGDPAGAGQGAPARVRVLR